MSATTTTATRTSSGSTSKMKDVLKLLQQTYEKENEILYSNQLEVLKNVPFYIWDEDHANLQVTPGSCSCFNHQIGLPSKDNHSMPMLPYQEMLHDKLINHKLIWIKKARGIGVSEFILRWIAYCCFNVFPAGSRVCIIVGNRISLAEDLIARLKGLFDKVAPGLYDRTNSTEAVINNVVVSAFPSYHSEAMRGLVNTKLILSDETDYYPSFQQREVRAVLEGYLAKPNSSPQILLVSTPKDPLGLMAHIENEVDSLYEKIFLDYKYGLEGPYPIYSKEQIEIAKKSPEFGREYQGLYSGVVGNTFLSSSIKRSVELGSNLHTDINRMATHVAGVDPGFTHFGLTVLELSDNIIKVVSANQYDKTHDSVMVEKIATLHGSYNLQCINVDGANPTFITAMKDRLGEDSNWHRIHDTMARCKREGFELNNYMRVCPVNFNEDGKFMLQHLKRLLDHDPSVLAINSKYDKLIVGLRSTISEEYKMDKSQPYNDLVDSCRLAAKFFELNDDNTPTNS
jgi:hypothetical protein